MTVAAVVLLPLLLSAQSPADKLFDKYSEMDGYTSVYITQHMFGLFADVETEQDESGFLDLVKNLNCIKVVAFDKESGEAPGNVNFYKEVIKSLPEDMYEELMVVKKKGQDIKFLIRKENDTIRELLMISGGENDNALISIQGNIDLKSISKLSRAMNIEGLENIEELENNNNNNSDNK